MYKHLLFAVSAVAIILLISNVMAWDSLSRQGSRILALEGAAVRQQEEIDRLSGKYKVLCSDPVLGSRAGREYVALSARASMEGAVTLELGNRHEDPIFVINVREVMVAYDSDEDRIAADYKSAPTFKNMGSNKTCSGIIDPGDSLECELGSYYSDVIRTTLENGDDTFIIKYISAELDIKPYYFVASDLCVRIAA